MSSAADDGQAASIVRAVEAALSDWPVEVTVEHVASRPFTDYVRLTIEPSRIDGEGDSSELVRFTDLESTLFEAGLGASVEGCLSAGEHSQSALLVSVRRL